MPGPLTPPPSSATEMADEARAAAPVEPIPATTPVPPASPIESKQPSLDPYQQIFPTIVNLAKQQDYIQLISVAERCDLNVCFLMTDNVMFLLIVWLGRGRSPTFASPPRRAFDTVIPYPR